MATAKKPRPGVVEFARANGIKVEPHQEVVLRLLEEYGDRDIVVLRPGRYRRPLSGSTSKMTWDFS